MNMNMKQPKAPRLVLYFQPWKPQQYDTHDSTYSLSILRVDPRDDKPRNCSRTGAWDAPGTEMFDDLAISCLLQWSNGKFSADCFDVTYRGYMVLSLMDLEVMRKGLKRIEKIRAAFPCRPQTFGQFAQMLCMGLGVKEICRETRANHTGFYTDNEYQYLPISYAQGFIDEEIERVRKLKLGEAQAA